MRSKYWKGILCLVCLGLAGLPPLSGAQEISGPRPPSGLRCEHMIDPMGVDTAAPRFSWILEHSERGQGQSAYEIIVSSQAGGESGEAWSSG
ncbi:MAG: hypothetical protein JXE07_04855, partial [Candidatus Aminicenantes bacterium]|nr:hypothetical protein [Candidatus Aminicenantes bacterium]